MAEMQIVFCDKVIDLRPVIGRVLCDRPKGHPGACVAFNPRLAKPEVSDDPAE